MEIHEYLHMIKSPAMTRLIEKGVEYPPLKNCNKELDSCVRNDINDINTL